MQDLLDKFFVRTSACAYAIGYPTLAAAKGALENLVNDYAKDPQCAREGPDGRWQFETSTQGILTLCIEDEKGSTCISRLEVARPVLKLQHRLMALLASRLAPRR